MRDDSRHTRHHVWILLAFVVVLVAALAAASPGRGQTDAGKTAPHAGKAAGPADPPLVDLAGYRQLLAKYKGKPLVVNFWATWCEPCRDEYPMIVELAKEFKPQGVNVIGVDMDDESDMNLVRRFIARTQPPFPNYRQKPGIDLDAFYDGVNPGWKGTMPQTIFYGRDGQILGFFLGSGPKADFEKAFRGTLGPAGSSGAGESSRGGAK
jgi:cytochrome c biogenesis protein CcmG, thiol:disulfide interchange protein DsbE